jgi:hypothetical protein
LNGEPKPDPNYEAYIETLKGALTEEKERFIFDERQGIEDALEIQGVMEADYLSGIITKAEFAAYNDRLAYAWSHKEAIGRVLLDYEYLKAFEGTGFSPEFLRYRHWERFLAPDAVDVTLVFCLAFFPVFFFSMEHASNMWRVIHAARHGKMVTIHTKLLCCLCVSAALAGLFFLSEFAGYLVFCRLDRFGAGIQSIRAFVGLSFRISLGQAVLLLALWRVLAASLVGVSVFLLSYLLHRDRVGFFVCFALLLFPVLIRRQLAQVYVYTFYPLLNGVSVALNATGESSPTGQLRAILGVCSVSVGVSLALYAAVYLAYFQRKRFMV